MSGDKEILALEDERYAAMCSGDFAALEASAISREPERLRDAQDTINGITDIVNRADLADRAPASSTCKRRADQQLRANFARDESEGFPSACQ